MPQVAAFRGLTKKEGCCYECINSLDIRVSHIPFSECTTESRRWSSYDHLLLFPLSEYVFLLISLSFLVPGDCVSSGLLSLLRSLAKEDPVNQRGSHSARSADPAAVVWENKKETVWQVISLVVGKRDTLCDCLVRRKELDILLGCFKQKTHQVVIRSAVTMMMIMNSCDPFRYSDVSEDVSFLTVATGKWNEEYDLRSCFDPDMCFSSDLVSRILTSSSPVTGNNQNKPAVSFFFPSSSHWLSQTSEKTSGWQRDEWNKMSGCRVAEYW